MWYKAQKLTTQGLTKSQKHRKTGLDRVTVRKSQTILDVEIIK